MDQKKTKEHPVSEPKDESAQKSQHESQQEKINDLTDTLKRLQAEFENYKKRVEKEKSEFTKYAKAPTLQKLLTILDTFEIALKGCKQHDPFSKGMEMVYSQMNALLDQEGVRKIESAGKMCDPHYHEVMLKEESDKKEGTILEELQRGYMLYDKVLRYAKVKVAKSKSGGPTKSSSNAVDSNDDSTNENDQE